MANLSSSKKAIRVSAKKRLVNLARKDKINAAVKSAKAFTKAGGLAKDSKEVSSKLQSTLDKAVKKGLISKNKANRMKSHTNKKLKAAVK